MKLNAAFLGLGIMGGAMAANLARAGFSISGWNRTPGRPAAMAAAQAGVIMAASAQEAARGKDVIFLCLTDAPDLDAMLFGAGALTAACKPGAVIVDMSTSGPECARDLFKRLQQLGLHFLDAPVSGGDVGARAGTLTIMVGGEEEIFRRCLPLFDAMGKTVRYCGTAGNGQALKLCNQILCAVNLVAVCEALQLADRLAIDPSLVVEVCQTGAAGSWSLANLGPRILKEDFAAGFKLKDMLKDLRLVGSCVNQLSEDLPGTALATDKLRGAKEALGTSGGDAGTQAMIRAYSARAGV